MTEYVYRIVEELNASVKFWNPRKNEYQFGGKRYHYANNGKPYSSKGAASAGISLIKKERGRSRIDYPNSVFYLERAPVPTEWTRI